MRLTRWPGIVRLANANDAAVRSYAAEDWRTPMRLKYLDLLVTLMRRHRRWSPEVATLADRWERTYATMTTAALAPPARPETEEASHG